MKAIFSAVLLVLLTLGAGASDVVVQAHQTSLFSYFKDPATANSNPAISGNAQLKLAVANGDDLLVGNTVLVGTFLDLTNQPVADSVIRAHATDLPFLMSDFKTYGSAKIGDGTGISGSLNMDVSGNSEGNPSLSGKQIYYFLVAGTDNSTTAKSFQTAFQIGVYYLPKSANSAWAFPAESPVPGSTTVDIADLTNSDAGLVLNPLAQVLVGTFGPDKANFPNGSNALNFSLAAVPEPTSGVLVSLASTGLLARRRRISVVNP